MMEVGRESESITVQTHTKRKITLNNLACSIVISLWVTWQHYFFLMEQLSSILAHPDTPYSYRQSVGYVHYVKCKQNIFRTLQETSPVHSIMSLMLLTAADNRRGRLDSTTGRRFPAQPWWLAAKMWPKQKANTNHVDYNFDSAL